MCTSSPGQKYIQHHEEKYPNHIDHLGQTTKDHTWGLREEPLGHGQNYVCYQGFQWKGIIHHEDKISPIQPEYSSGSIKY